MRGHCGSSAVCLGDFRLVVVDPAFMRPAEVDQLVGDARKARETLHWRPEVSFRELIRMMVDEDLARLRAEHGL